MEPGGTTFQYENVDSLIDEKLFNNHRKETRVFQIDCKDSNKSAAIAS